MRLRLADAGPPRSSPKRVSIIQGGKSLSSGPQRSLGGEFAIQQPPGCVQSLGITYPKIKRRTGYIKR